MSMIKLTEIEYGVLQGTIYVRADAIVRMARLELSTQIIVGGSYTYVKETPEEILALMQPPSFSWTP